MAKKFKQEFHTRSLLVWAVKSAKNAEPDKYAQSNYNIGFDPRSRFSLPNCEWSKNVVGEGPTDGLNDTTRTAEAKCSSNITKSRKKDFFESALQCN